MTTVYTTLFNYHSVPELQVIFSKFSNEYVFDNGTFYKKIPPNCPCCNERMIHNGYNQYQKQNFIKIKIGKYICPSCKKNVQESSEIFTSIIAFLKNSLFPVILKMRAGKMSYCDIADVMASIIPMSKDTILRIIEEIVEEMEIKQPEKRNFQFLGYDEQYVKVNGELKYRLTILDLLSRIPIVDVIASSKDSEEIISLFKNSSLDFNKPTIIITDLDKKYPEILNELFGKNLLHLRCLFHLLKRIKLDFPKYCSILDLILQEKIFNVFYDHTEEIEWLSQFIDKEAQYLALNDKKAYKEWLKRKHKEFRAVCKNNKNLRRRNHETRKIRPFQEIIELFIDLLENKEQYSPIIQKRLESLDKNLVELTAFCEGLDMPTTNNLIEGYFSSTLQKAWKRRMKTIKGLSNHLKLYQIKVQGLLEQTTHTIIEAFVSVASIIGLYTKSNIASC